MPELNKRSKDILKGCHKDLQLIAEKVSEEYPCVVISGHRGKDEQNLLFHSGRSKLEFPDSKHNEMPSEAIDIIPFPVNWTDRESFYSLGGYIRGIAKRLLEEGLITHRVRWGGDWDNDFNLKDQSFIDLPHVELIPPICIDFDKETKDIEITG